MTYDSTADTPGVVVRRFVALVVVLATLEFPTEVVAADRNAEAAFAGAVNTIRAEQGLNTLDRAGDLAAHARAQTQKMIAAGTLAHSTTLPRNGRWEILGENIGHGPDVGGIVAAFNASASHRANMLSDYTHMGVGADRDAAGNLYVTIVFGRAVVPSAPDEPLAARPEKPEPARPSRPPVVPARVPQCSIVPVTGLWACRLPGSDLVIV